MTQDISSLRDGELDAHDAGRVIKTCGSSEAHKDTWNLYGVIGDVIRGETPRSLDRSSRVMEALAKEPTVIGRPRTNVFESTLGRVALAAAASVATIGVVSWIGTQGGAPGTMAPVVAKNGSPAAAIQPVSATATVSQPAIDVQDYVIAHRQIPSAEAYRPVVNRGTAATR